eukprot:s1008_g7.t1
MLVHGNLVEGGGPLGGRPRWPGTGQKAKGFSCPSLQADVPRSAFWSHFVISVSAGGVAVGLSRCSQRRHHQQARAKRLACVARFADQSNAVKGFIDWMDASGIVTSNNLEILPDPEGGRCVKSTAAIQKGEVLVQLPEASAVSVDMSEASDAPSELAPLAEWWSGNPRSSIRLAAVLVFQREKFGPYIDMLYPMENIYAPWLWEDEDLRFLPEKLAANAAARRRALDSACADLKAKGLAEAVPEELFLRAHHAAASRAFAGEGEVSSARTAALACGALALTAAGAAAATGVTSLDAAAGVGAVGVAASGAVVALSEDSKVLSLLPMIDQINHKSGAPPDLQFDPASRRWELRALRAYSAGEEICFSYGDKDSDALLLQHGFVEEDNGADKLTLPLPAAGLYGLSAKARSELDALGVQELVFARDGSLQGLTEEGQRCHAETAALGACRRFLWLYMLDSLSQLWGCVQDGQMFDSSFLRTKEPEMFEVSEVLSAWRAALLEMREGEKTRVWVPASRPTELDWGVYSERGQYPWVFDIELIKVEEDPPYFLIALLVLPIIAGELYIRITGKTPGDALNEYLYGGSESAISPNTSFRETDSCENDLVSRQNLAEVVAATLRSAVPSCSAAEDAEVSRSVSSPGIGRVLLRWRAERRKLLEAAAERWKVKDVKQ